MRYSYITAFVMNTSSMHYSFEVVSDIHAHASIVHAACIWFNIFHLLVCIMLNDDVLLSRLGMLYIHAHMRTDLGFHRCSKIHSVHDYVVSYPCCTPAYVRTSMCYSICMSPLFSFHIHNLPACMVMMIMLPVHGTFVLHRTWTIFPSCTGMLLHTFFPAHVA
jgi:hypothetical protein